MKLKFWKKDLNDEEYLTYVEACIVEEALQLEERRKRGVEYTT